VVENGTLPETDKGTTYAVIIVGRGDDDEAESEAQGDCEDAIHRKGKHESIAVRVTLTVRLATSRHGNK